MVRSGHLLVTTEAVQETDPASIPQAFFDVDKFYSVYFQVQSVIPTELAIYRAISTRNKHWIPAGEQMFCF